MKLFAKHGNILMEMARRANVRKRQNVRHLALSKRIILKRILKVCGVGIWTGLISG